MTWHGHFCWPTLLFKHSATKIYQRNVFGANAFFLNHFGRFRAAYCCICSVLRLSLKSCFVLVHLIKQTPLSAHSSIWRRRPPNVVSIVYNVNTRGRKCKLQGVAKPWTIKAGAIASANEFERVESYFGTRLIDQIGCWSAQGAQKYVFKQCHRSDDSTCPELYTKAWWAEWNLRCSVAGSLTAL